VHFQPRVTWQSKKSIVAWIDPFPWQFYHWIAASNGILRNTTRRHILAVLLAMTIWKALVDVLYCIQEPIIKTPAAYRAKRRRKCMY